MSQPILRALRTVAAPLFGKGYWSAPVLRTIASWYKQRYRPAFVEIDGNRLYLNYEDGWYSSYLAVHGYCEKTETDLVKRYAKPGMTALDIGANIGYYSLILSSIVGPEGHVIAFEPDRKNLDFLRRSTDGLATKNVEIVPSAVWESTGTLELFLNPEDLIDHSVVPGGSGERPHYSVPAIAVDDYLDGRQVDFIKMDIQGAEGRALEGMERTLAKHPPRVLITEFWPSALRRAGTPPEEVFARLADIGYSIRQIDEDNGALRPASIERILAECDIDWKFTNLLCTLDD